MKRSWWVWASSFSECLSLLVESTVGVTEQALGYWDEIPPPVAGVTPGLLAGHSHPAGRKANMLSSPGVQMLTKLKDEDDDDELRDRSAADLDNLRNTDWVRTGLVLDQAKQQHAGNCVCVWAADQPQWVSRLSSEVLFHFKIGTYLNDP